MPVLDPALDPFIGPKDLPALGIKYCRQHLWLMTREGDFPPAITISPRKRVWRRSTILEWIAKKERASMRGAVAA